MDSILRRMANSSGKVSGGDHPLAGNRILGMAEFVERVMKEPEPKVQYPFRFIGNQERMEKLIKESCRKKGAPRAEVRMGVGVAKFCSCGLNMPGRCRRSLGFRWPRLSGRRNGISQNRLEKALMA